MSKKVIPCEVYSRVVGYYRPVQDWNRGKQEEYHDRAEITDKQVNQFVAGPLHPAGGG